MTRPRIAALVASLCLVAAACSGGSKGTGQVGNQDLIPATTKAPSADSGPAGTPTSGAPAGAPGAQASSKGRPAQSQNGGTLPAFKGGSLPPPPGTSSDADQGALGATGAYARTLLRPTPATTIQLELLEGSGATPNATALAYLTAMVQKVTQKSVATRQVPIAAANQPWTVNQMIALVTKYGTPNKTGAKTATLHLLVLHGELSNSPGVLGVAFRGDVLALFPDRFNSQPQVYATQTTEAVYTHETGHLLGLVDEVINDHRGDPNDPAQPSHHSPDKKSVMYWAIDADVMSQAFNGPPPTDFDTLDYNDLARLRGGA